MFKRIFYCYLVLLVSFLLPCLAHARSVVMMFGDSITKGVPYITISGNGGHFGPSVLELEKLLNDSYRPALVVNWGIGGQNSSHGANRIEDSIDSTLETHEGERYFILLHYGTNDRDYGILASTTGFNTEQMIRRAKSKGVTPIVGALLPKSEEDVVPYNKKIKSAAESQSVPFVNHYPDFLPVGDKYFVLEDGEYLHPNLDGYSLIASNWFNDILSTLIPDERPLLLPFMYQLLKSGQD
jgi:lysophospholipase L1-like esterase